MNKEYPDYLIFLDFDGVCNCYGCGSYVTSTPEEYSFSKIIIQRLKGLCKETGARIVISSNWRRFADDGSYVFDGKRVSNPLPKLRKALGKFLFDELPKDRHVRKAEALILWLEDNPDFKGKFAILDDDIREGYAEYPQFNKNMFFCDPKFGFSEDKMKSVKKHFKG